MQWEVVIGLETHVQLSTKTKIFSAASTDFGAEPNTHACVVDLALPGTLPVLNRGAVEKAMKFGLAIGAKVASRSIFDRKNYFYPDLPKGYQISQFEWPIVIGGQVSFMVTPKKGEPYMKTLNLTRAHLEEDAGKSVHGCAWFGGRTKWYRLKSCWDSLVGNRDGAGTAFCRGSRGLCKNFACAGCLAWHQSRRYAKR